MWSLRNKSLSLPIILSLATCITAILTLANDRISVRTSSNTILVKEASDTPIDSQSLVAFNTMMKVLTHPRCVNCHPSDDVPKQGIEARAHRFGITRSNAQGATNCHSCHQESNNRYSGVPGAPEWALAPHKMRWEGLNRVEIARSMLDPESNGNRSKEDLMHHLTEHELVLWAWNPGVDAEGKPREKPPVPVEEYIEAVKKWIELGAQIPEE